MRSSWQEKAMTTETAKTSADPSTQKAYAPTYPLTQDKVAELLDEIVQRIR